MSLPRPPDLESGDFTREVSAWVVCTLEGTLLRAVPSLAEHPRAAGRVAWFATQAIIYARGKQDLGLVSMSAAIADGALDGALPEEDIIVLRGLQRDPAEAPGAEELVKRLEYLERVGGRLPRHIYTQ